MLITNSSSRQLNLKCEINTPDEYDAISVFMQKKTAIVNGLHLGEKETASLIVRNKSILEIVADGNAVIDVKNYGKSTIKMAC